MTDKSDGFQKLQQFLLNDMKMSHIYQPVFIKALLENDGSASASKIS